MKFNILQLISLVVGILFIIPILFLIFSIQNIESEIWIHLKSYILPEVVLTTFYVVTTVSIFSITLGVILSIFNVFYSFPGKKLFKVLNILPLGIPPFISAYIYLALFDSTGIISIWLKNFFQLDFFLPSIRNIYGLSFILTLSLTPYVYLLMNQAFKIHGATSLEIGNSIGLSFYKILTKLIFPLVLPTLAACAALIFMEIFAEFGAVSIFGLTTFSTAIYRTWFGLQSLNSAILISVLVIFLIIIVTTVQWIISKLKNTTKIGNKNLSVSPKTLLFPFNLVPIFFELLYIGFSLIIPVSTLIYWTILIINREFELRYFTYFSNSIYFAFLTIFPLIMFSLIMSLNQRLQPNKINLFLKNLASIGYAIPGAVSAISLFLIISFIENEFFKNNRFITTTSLGLVLGLNFRFFSVAFAPLEDSFKNLLNSHIQFLDLINLNPFIKFKRIYFPLISSGLITSILLVTVEVIKEIPITLMMRPFGKETLAIRIFELTSEGEWTRAALPSLILVIICLIPAFLIIKQENKNEG